MARPLRLLAVTAATLATGLAACSLITGLDADYKLQAVVEGGRDSDVEPDTGLDARADTSPLLDGGGDTSADARYCERYGDAANVVYCCDFETAAGGCTWDGDEKTNGTLVEEDGVGNNGSRGLHATVLKGPASLYLRRELPAFNGFSKHELSFAFTVKTKSSLYGATLGALGLGPTPTLKLIGVSVYKASPKDGIDISDPPGSLTGSSEFVDKGDWRRATITMQRAGAGPYTTTVVVTSKTGTLTQVDSRLGFDGGAGPTEILVGAFFTSPEPDGGVETVIDDVLVTQTK
ncbi:MAG TPA: hypothetical protein VLT33_48715 [Labilithrix sp.]|nr:hypothetical protein [Labilithrix sp.]